MDSNLSPPLSHKGWRERALGDGPVLGKVHVEAGPACSPQGLRLGSWFSWPFKPPFPTPSPPPVPAPEEISLRPSVYKGMQLLLHPRGHLLLTLTPGAAALLLQTQSVAGILILTGM